LARGAHTCRGEGIRGGGTSTRQQLAGGNAGAARAQELVSRSEALRNLRLLAGNELAVAVFVAVQGDFHQTRARQLGEEIAQGGASRQLVGCVASFFFFFFFFFLAGLFF
jgi:hypothetical protein